MHAARVALLLALVLVPPAGADELAERIPVGPGGRLEVDLDLGPGLRPDPGSLEVRSHDASFVRVQADTSGWGAPGVELRLDHDADTVRLFGHVGGAFSFLFGGPRVSVRIWVPRRFELDLRCTGGPVRVEEVSGPLRVRSVDGAIEVVAVGGGATLRARGGDVRAHEVEGPLRISTTEGDVDVAWLRGDAEARTGDGDVRVAHATGDLRLRSDWGTIEVDEVDGRVEAVSERGSVSARFASAPAGSLETRRGPVEVWIPGDAGLELEAVTRRGEVTLDPGIALSGPQGSDRVTGRVNGGGDRLRLYTARGAIHVRRR